MSPSKSLSTATKRANIAKSVSAIPRRVKQSTTKDGSIFAGESVNVSPPKPISYHDMAGANKENLPATISGGRVTYAVSPSRQPSKFNLHSSSVITSLVLRPCTKQWQMNIG